MSSMLSWGWWPSTLQPTDGEVPRISLMVPESSLARDGCRICRAVLTVSSKVMFPLCLMFFCFLLSLGGSSRALMIGAEAEGATPVWACLFWVVSFTVILRLCQSPVALAMSSLTFFRDRPRGPIQGRHGTDFPTGACQIHDFDLVRVKLRRHGGGGWCRMNPDLGQLKKVAPWSPPSWKQSLLLCYWKRVFAMTILLFPILLFSFIYLYWSLRKAFFFFHLFLLVGG